jgi:transcriptional regulator with XRE-family HTH domain
MEKKIMAARGRGGGKTPERIVKLICDAVAESSQAQVAKDTGQTRLTIQRYMKGIGEPSQATLEKLSAYFKRPVEWLRGSTKENSEGLHFVIKSITEHFKKARPDLSPEERDAAGLKIFCQMTIAVRAAMEEVFHIDKEESRIISESVLNSVQIEDDYNDAQVEDDEKP